jgi:hypothetical protein
VLVGIDVLFLGISVLPVAQPVMVRRRGGGKGQADVSQKRNQRRRTWSSFFFMQGGHMATSLCGGSEAPIPRGRSALSIMEILGVARLGNKNLKTQCAEQKP